jgi:hypothetical protein
MNLALLERTISPCPVIDCEDYEKHPLITGRDWYMMERQVLHINRHACVFFFMRFEDEEPYIEIYIWERKKQLEAEYTRFIIREGMCLSEKLEQKLLFYTKHARLTGYSEQLEALYYLVNEYFPQWHYTGYKPSQISQAVEHIYFASHHSGPREILYKADLGNIAYNLEKFESYNALGTTPQDILGYNAPIKLLRIINQRPFLEYCCDSKAIKRCVDVYAHYSGFIAKSLPTIGQWLYLEGLYVRGMVDKEDFSRKLYDLLDDVNGDLTFSRQIVFKYFDIIELRNKTGISQKRSFPEVSEIEDELIALENVSDPKLIELSDKRVQNNAHSFEYSDDRYAVVFPKTLLDIHKEATALKNCLDSFIALHAYGNSTILFVREKDNPDKPFVAIEVVAGRINQAYKACNNPPDPEVLSFLYKYARIRGYSFDPDKACRIV